MREAPRRSEKKPSWSVSRAARGVDEVDHREQVTVGAFQDADLLLAGQLAPGTRLDGEVVRDDGHRPAVDASHSGPHAVGGQAVRGGVREQAVLAPAARVEQPSDPLVRGQLALACQLLPALLGHLLRGFDGERDPVSHGSASGADDGDPGRAGAPVEILHDPTRGRPGT